MVSFLKSILCFFFQVTTFTVKLAEFDVFYSQYEIVPVFFPEPIKYSVSVSKVVSKLYFDTEDYQYRYTKWNYILQVYTNFTMFVVERLLQNMVMLLMQ